MHPHRQFSAALPEALGQLRDLVVSTIGEVDWRSFLLRFAEGSEILKGFHVPLHVEQFVLETLKALDRRALLDNEFFEQLIRFRPARAAAWISVAAHFGYSPRGVPRRIPGFAVRVVVSIAFLIGGGLYMLHRKPLAASIDLRDEASVVMPVIVSWPITAPQPVPAPPTEPVAQGSPMQQKKPGPTERSSGVSIVGDDNTVVNDVVLSDGSSINIQSR